MRERDAEGDVSQKKICIYETMKIVEMWNIRQTD